MTGTRRLVAVLFLLPALVLLGALVLYPIGYSLFRSFFDASGDFTAFGNYKTLFTDDGILTAIKNNAIWLVVAPTVATALGLIFAVLTERVRWGTAFKLVIFMPMAISMLAAGIIFRLVYESDPDRGVANAVAVSVHDTFAESSAFPRAHPAMDSPLKAAGGGAFITREPVRAGEPVALPLTGVPPNQMPDDAKPAKAAQADPAKVTGMTWQDFTRGKGRGRPNAPDTSESGYAGIRIEAVKGGEVVASTEAAADGTFALPKEADGAHLRFPASNFREPYNGVDWLGPSLITPAVIGSYLWMWAGFAMVLIAAGLASVPRELLEAARVDGANEWQVFRRVTVPLLAPVLAVVLVTLMINVLKIFDLVFVIPPGSSKDDANVLALQLYNSAFGDRDAGVASAIAMLLFLLVIPVMLFNVRRMRREARR
ncbi:sugar ABC transporter permease [Streptomyces sp. G44]|uniref:carbohydrate ABC transporter permease n=1 Tax=Streptomyces sp. G44 TaxID=2807632 RepID=UPI001961F2A9|nr:sugar ABC transporter permease [Streptomyces sp. G44]MBM7172957.1 sugar ABC transporter permease [Streptomyces sp. G44]